MNILEALKKFGGLIKRAFVTMEESGFNDKMIEIALPLVRQAVVKFGENAARREWVVATLMAKGIPEGFARMAVELALKLMKKELQIT